MSKPIHLLQSLIFFLFIALLQISLSQSLHNSTPTSNTCTPECAAGQECVMGSCVCPQNCSGSAHEPVCGSNGVTYNNLCKLEKAKCELAQNISVLFKGQCCEDHQRSFEREFNYNECKDLEPSDDIKKILKCFRPQCNNHFYQTKQCGFISPVCWCSSSSGEVINGTQSRSRITPSYCNTKQVCKVDGQTYNEGQIFTPSSFCGLCECLSGAHTCYVNFTVNVTGHLTPTQLATLKQALVQEFHYQRTKSNGTNDIRTNLKTFTEVSTSDKENALEWKFRQYDKNQDGNINPTEELIFQQEVVAVFGTGCSKFRNHLRELYNSNNDTMVSLHEWKSFFGVNSQTTSGSAEASEELMDNPSPAKREAPFAMRKPLHLRKKFIYQLS